jgi:ketosteroid isomerase-like protein
MSPVETVLEFMNRINQREAGKLAELMTEDHVFIDSLGHGVVGRDKVRAAFAGYYRLCPDYWVSQEQMLADGNVVAVFGAAGGTIDPNSAADGPLLPENQWRTPAAWLAIVKDGLLQQWRVYADNQPVYEILAKSRIAPASGPSAPGA